MSLKDLATIEWEKGYDLLKKHCNWKTIAEKNFKVYEK